MELDHVGSETFECEISEDIKNENKKCFLHYKEELKYHSVVLLEIINFEDFEDFINGLNKLYTHSNEVDKINIEKIEEMLRSEIKLFQWWSLPLPLITNSRLKAKLPFGIYHDLGSYINEINITLYGILPSMVILQIHVDLNFTFSDKINQVLYKLHNETVDTIKTPKINYTKRISPKECKEAEIRDLRCSIKNQAIKFFSEYFEGYFFKLYKSKPSVVPSIDIFSFTYPIADNDIIKWEKNMNDFFECFSTDISPDTSFKHDRYLLSREKYLESNFNNYLMFANRECPNCPEFSDFDNSIEVQIRDCSFELLAFDRLMDIQKNVVGTFNEMISKEIRYLESDKLNKAFENRKALNSKLFYFDRFKIEFKQYMKNDFQTNKFNFVNITGNNDFFNNIIKNIDFRIIETDNLIKTFTKHSNSILELKNIEYTKKTQDRVLFLTIVVVILTLVQIYLAFINNPKM